MTALHQQYHITPASLQHRHQFLNLTSQDSRVLSRLAGWAMRAAAPLAADFYDNQFSFRPTAEFFERHAQRRGIPVEKIRQIFEEAQAGGNLGPDYFEKRLKVGQLHHMLNLPLKWYVGSYARYQDLALQWLTQQFKLDLNDDQPHGRSAPGRTARPAESMPGMVRATHGYHRREIHPTR
jgi:hypothetical protein